MNDIGDDIYKAISGNGESRSRRLRLCRDGSHRLDTLDVSNCSSRNGNSWFVALIASLYIMAKTFAKIVKTFVGLLATIVVKGRTLVLILHLESKYAKMDCKNEIYAKNWVRSTWTAKVNPGKVNGQLSRSQSQHWNSQLPEVKVNLEMTSAMTQLGLTWQDDVVVMSAGTRKRVRARVGAWRRVWRRAVCMARGGTHRKCYWRMRARGPLDGDRSGVAR